MLNLPDIVALRSDANDVVDGARSRQRVTLG